VLLQDKVAVVTGAARGIGRGVALRFAREGAHLALVDLDEDVARTAADEIRQLGRRTWVHVADMSRIPDVQEMVRLAAREFGRIDILVNNAGRSGPKPLLEITGTDWDQIFELRDEAPDAGTSSGEAVIVDEVLPDRHGVATPGEGLLNELPVGLAGAGRGGPAGG
jgi:NADP-dependent 3-hydroxy acid dehydrogenase YdfG